MALLIGRLYVQILFIKKYVLALKPLRHKAFAEKPHRIRRNALRETLFPRGTIQVAAPGPVDERNTTEIIFTGGPMLTRNSRRAASGIVRRSTNRIPMQRTLIVETDAHEHAY